MLCRPADHAVSEQLPVGGTMAGAEAGHIQSRTGSGRVGRWCQGLLRQLELPSCRRCHCRRCPCRHCWWWPGLPGSRAGASPQPNPLQILRRCVYSLLVALAPRCRPRESHAAQGLSPTPRSTELCWYDVACMQQILLIEARKCVADNQATWPRGCSEGASGAFG